MKRALFYILAVCLVAGQASADMTTGAILDAFSVPALNTPVITSSVSLDAGAWYRFEVSGTYNAGDSITADAEYSSRLGHAWLDGVEPPYDGYGLDLLDLKVNDGFLNWGPYNDSHIYTLDFMGLGNTVQFQINDFYPSNDSGNLNVKIYALVPAPAAVMIGMLGLGVAGLKLRKFV
jgi:hypothetical protein